MFHIPKGFVFILLSIAFLTALPLSAQNTTLGFDGSNDYASVTGLSASSTSILTAECWFMFESYPSEYRWVYHLYSGDRRRVLLGVNESGYIAVYMAPQLSDDTGGNVLTSTVLAETGKWYHAAVVVNGSNLKFYINGISLFEQNFSYSWQFNDNHTLYLATDYWAGSTAYSDIRIDEMRLWSSVRSQSDIQSTMHTQLSGSESGLFAYYKMSDGSGTSLTDNSSHGNTGTLHNETYWVSNDTTPIAVAPSAGDGSAGTPYQIANLNNLWWISQNSSVLGQHFTQTADINLIDYQGGAGWKPIGNATTQFTGTYDGDGHKIMNLFLYYPGAGTPTTVTEAQALPGNIGLFGYMTCTSSSDAIIRDLGILNADVTGGRATGSLVGKILLPSNAAYVTYVENCYVAGTATVRGFGATGGLVGANNSQKKNIVPVIHYCYSEADVESRFPTNTLLNPDDNDELFNIKYGSVVGCNENGLTMDSYGRGDVYGGKRVGGISGCSIRGAVIRCYATGQIRTAFQSPPYSGDEDPYVGGIVGRVVGQLPPGLGGFSGSGSIQMCYWDTSTSGNTTSGGSPGALGRTTSEMQTQANYTDWNFDGVWLISASQYPRLGWQDGVNINPQENTYEGMLAPTVDGGTAQPNQLYSTTSVGGSSVYTGFMPSATETVNISIYSIYSENPQSVEGDFPNPENLGAYWKFYCSDDVVLRNAQYFDIQMPFEYTQIWYRYSRDTSELLSWRLIPSGSIAYQSGSYIYRITISGLSLPAPLRVGELGEIEFAGDIGNDNTLPVVLSSFTAEVTSENFARVSWETQSETDMSGYYLHRSETASLEDAVRVSTMISAENSSNGASYSFTDIEVTRDETYRYWLESIGLDGSSIFFGPVTITIVPDGGQGQETPEAIVTELVGCYPNPFNPNTVVQFSVDSDRNVRLAIYNLKGQLVRILADESFAKGKHCVSWDGRDFNGGSASSGVYFIRMDSGAQQFTTRALLLK